jgi:pyruvate dehydrogenase E2 component (dihydrolipoamide acetyltransferase)
MNAAASLAEVRVPDMGSFKDVAVIDVLVKPGDTIEVEASLVTLETEKATMDVPSTVAGVVEKLHVAKGGRVSPGDLIATVRSAAAAVAEAAPPTSPAAAPSAPAAQSTPAPAKAASVAVASSQTEAAKPPAASAPVAAAPASAPPAATAAKAAAPAAVSTDFPPFNEPGFSRAHAGPSVRMLARELGVDLTRVTGTGFKARITHDDVKAYVKKSLSAPAAAPAGGALPSVPVVDFAQFGAIETKPLSRIQKISGPRLHASWVNIPHVTQFDDADITELEELRGKLKQTAQDAGIKLTPLAFIVRACVRALQEFPLFNASLDAGGTNLILKKYVHVGFAADTPNGLVVPVVRDADKKDVYKTARELAELSEKARGGKLRPPDMQGGCFTISSLGGIGGTAFTPIINAPEVAILGVSRAAMRPVYKDGAFVPRLILPLSLSYDHRVIDGASAARFTTFLAQTLANPHQLVEAIP